MPAKRPDLFSDDPPVLRALLLAAGDDKEVRAQISRAYYGQMEGSAVSPVRVERDSPERHMRRAEGFERN